MPKNIVIKGARVNNLKNIDVEIPRDSLVVLTGLSGSGKSSLAFDTLYAEGHRRFVESLSSYARMFLGQLDKPDVDSIEGLSPAISIDQKTTSKNPRSTVDTLSVSRISHPRERVAVGEKLWAAVRDVGDNGSRIYMSLRELLGTWEENAALFSPAQTVTGTVRSVEEYGVFVELMPNLCGLAELRDGAAPGKQSSDSSVLPAASVKGVTSSIISSLSATVDMYTCIDSRSFFAIFMV